MSAVVLFFIVGTCGIIAAAIYWFACILGARQDEATNQAWEDFSHSQRSPLSAVHLHADTYAEEAQRDHG